jgi:hypothetical protein
LVLMTYHFIFTHSVKYSCLTLYRLVNHSLTSKLSKIEGSIPIKLPISRIIACDECPRVSRALGNIVFAWISSLEISPDTR